MTDLSIRLSDWEITYDEFVDWTTRNNIVVSAINYVPATYGVNRYEFESEEDLLAFKLSFKKSDIVSYKTKRLDTAYYYCPYIPPLCPSSPSDSTT